MDGTPSKEIYWALTPAGWVPCDGFADRPRNSLEVACIRLPRTCGVEDGGGATLREHVGYGVSESATLIARFGEPPKWPVPQSSLQWIVSSADRIFGSRSRHPAGWDALRDALIEACYLRGLVNIEKLSRHTDGRRQKRDTSRPDGEDHSGRAPTPLTPYEAHP